MVAITPKALAKHTDPSSLTIVSEKFEIRNHDVCLYDPRCKYNNEQNNGRRRKSSHLPAAPALWCRVWSWSSPGWAGSRTAGSAGPAPSSPSAPAAGCCWRCCWNRPSSPRSPTSYYADPHASGPPHALAIDDSSASAAAAAAATFCTLVPKWKATGSKHRSAEQNGEPNRYRGV